MQKYSAVNADPHRSLEMKATQRWIERFVCRVMPRQGVVGRRTSHLTGQLVTPGEAIAQAQSAHVCPFVQESINRDDFWLEESRLANKDAAQIDALLRQQAIDFIATAPIYDPQITGAPAGPTFTYKTFMTVFPNVVQQTGQPHLFDAIHQAVKPDLADMGLMLGQFYYGCFQPAIYDPTWTGVVLSSPYPAFALRYMVLHDEQFNGIHPARTAVAYKKYFP